jgi:hypothetical protein
MRRLLLILMISLLPLRGWVGDVMAVEMSTAAAAQKANATELVANYVYPTLARGQFDGKNAVPAHLECPGHAAAAAGPTADSTSAGASVDVVASADDAPNGHCNTCSVCQICHSVALASAVVVYLPNFTANTLPFTGSTRFASAFTALSQKPPIS